MLSILNSLVTRLENEADKIATYVKSGGAYVSDVFEQPIEFLPSAARPKSLVGRRGVYVFMIEDNFHASHEQLIAWNNVGSAGFKSWDAVDLVKGDCLYLGSCASESGGSLFTRMKEHLSAHSDQAALQLAHIDRSFIASHIKIYVFPLKDEYRNYCRIILTTVEKKMHSVLNPKAGGNRV